MSDEGLAEGVSLVPGTSHHCPLPEFLCKLLAIRKERGNCLPQLYFSAGRWRLVCLFRFHAVQSCVAAEEQSITRNGGGSVESFLLRTELVYRNLPVFRARCQHKHSGITCCEKKVLSITNDGSIYPTSGRHPFTKHFFSI